MSDCGRPVLIASLSGRALARSARSAGLPAVVVDLFGDVDTRQMSRAVRTARGQGYGFEAPSLLDAADRIDPKRQAPVLFGSGFEQDPAQLAELCRHRPLLGNEPEVVAAVSDPWRFHRLLERLGIPHPEPHRELPPGRGPWLAKRAGACGGGHVRRVCLPQETAPPDLYFQRRLAGRSVSLTLLADGREARVLGYCEQWCASRPGPRPYTYAGAVTLSPQALPRGLAGALAEAVEALARALGLRGLCTLDTIVSGGQWWALELNPRPGATLELHERGASLLGLHIEAVRGHLPRRPPPLGAGARAHAIVYAPRRLKVPPRWRWPGWVSDLPQPGTSLAPGDPVCTVHARGPDSGAARRQAWQKRQTVMGWTDTWLKN